MSPLGALVLIAGVASAVPGRALAAELEERPSVFTYAGRGFLVGAMVGVSAGYLSARSGGWDRDGDWQPLVYGTGIGALAGGYGHGVTVGDFDNDGDPDLFVTRWRSYALYRNRGDGHFEDVTGRAGLGGDRDWPTSSAFAAT